MNRGIAFAVALFAVPLTTGYTKDFYQSYGTALYCSAFLSELEGTRLPRLRGNVSDPDARAMALSVLSERVANGKDAHLAGKSAAMQRQLRFEMIKKTNAARFRARQIVEGLVSPGKSAKARTDLTAELKGCLRAAGG